MVVHACVCDWLTSPHALICLVPHPAIHKCPDLPLTVPAQHMFDAAIETPQQMRYVFQTFHSLSFQGPQEYLVTFFFFRGL